MCPGRNGSRGAAGTFRGSLWSPCRWGLCIIFVMTVDRPWGTRPSFRLSCSIAGRWITRPQTGRPDRMALLRPNSLSPLRPHDRLIYPHLVTMTGATHRKASRTTLPIVAALSVCYILDDPAAGLLVRNQLGSAVGHLFTFNRQVVSIKPIAGGRLIFNY